MKKPEIVFLDKIPQAETFGTFRSSQNKIFVAKSLEGLARFRQEAAAEEASLCVWIQDKKSLLQIKDEALHLKAQFLFPYKGLKPSEIAKAGSFKGPEDLELPDHRIGDTSLLEPDVQILQEAQNAGPHVSVVIPMFDNQIRASKALQSWLSQTHRQYEIVLVDDGSSQPWIEQLVGQYPEKLSLIKISRAKERRRGDHNFRAGLARNFGVQFSRGAKIIFSDSDIVVAPHMIETVSESLEQADLVMPLRWQLNEESSGAFRSYQDISFNRDVVLSPGSYWESFQTDTAPWQTQLNYWRWTSTFCLGTLRSALQKTGLFKKSFVSYGFEDTELGYRFHQLKMKFALAPIATYHLFQPATHSEYQNDLEQKERLLRISADRFFRHHPSKEVYDTLQIWLD